MSAVVAAVAAAAGVCLVMAPASSTTTGSQRIARLRDRARSALDRAGLEQISPRQFVAASALSALVVAAAASVLLGPGIAAGVAGLGGAAIPTSIWRRRRAARQEAARSAWPQLLEELRIRVGASGRSVPQALIDVGLAGPPELAGAFRAAQREWALSTDFPRTIAVLKRHLADPTADAVCENLLIASEVGGDLDARLALLAEDRRADQQGRREAEAKQAGARLARVFVIVVPAGMAFAGLSVGEGAAAYRTTTGQVLVAVGLSIVAGCWVWASRIMTLPQPRRVFER